MDLPRGKFQEKVTLAPLLGELDKSVSLLSEMAPDDVTRELGATLLRDSFPSGAAPFSQGAKTVAQKLESASDDEIVDSINKELGRSRART
jgi:hypothetical protein